MEGSTPAQPERNPNEGHRARLRERFARAGFGGFSDHEVVELLLTLCIPRRDVKAPAKALLQRFGSLRAILDAPAEQLAETPGIGEVAPVALRVIREAANLYLQQSAEGGELLNSVERIESFWRARLGGLRHEVFEAAYLDSGWRLLPNGIERLQEGTINQTAVYPRQVMAAALRRSAFAIVVAHNHPNGICQPSDHDFRLTDALADAAKPLGIKLLDHLIIAGGRVYSFRREKHLR